MFSVDHQTIFLLVSESEHEGNCRHVAGNVKCLTGMVEVYLCAHLDLMQQKCLFYRAGSQYR